MNLSLDNEFIPATPFLRGIQKMRAASTSGTGATAGKAVQLLKGEVLFSLFSELNPINFFIEFPGHILITLGQTVINL